MIQCESICDSRAAIVTDNTEALESLLAHHTHHIESHFPLRVR
jgi:hypothetical protein